MTYSLGHRLEQYTLKHPQEVLLVSVDLDGTEDQVIVFKGFSSSLTRPTAFDPETPVIPETAKILSIDRLQGPYSPESPRYIDRNMTLEMLERFLTKAGV